MGGPKQHYIPVLLQKAFRIGSKNPGEIRLFSVSKADGSQSLNLQRDALVVGGADRVYEDCASGAKDYRPGL